MVDPEVVRRRLQKLDEYLAVLDGLRRHARQEFLADPEKYGAAERFLQLAIEALTDLGNHVIADQGLGSVESYGDIPRLLQEAGLVEDALANQWVKMIGFRNILVHEYLDIDRETVFAALRERLGDLRALQRAFARFLTVQPGGGR